MTDFDPATEVWRPVPGYEGRFDVSDQGRVRSWVARAFQGPTPYVKTPRLQPSGYLMLQLSTAAFVRNSLSVHKVVTLAFLGPRPDGLQVRHLDGDKTNNHLTNLAYGTPKENGADTRRLRTAANLRVTHCPQGHAYDEANTYVNPRGCRNCRTCRNEASRRWTERRRAS